MRPLRPPPQELEVSSWKPSSDAGGTQKTAVLRASGTASYAERSAPRLARAPSPVPLLGRSEAGGGGGQQVGVGRVRQVEVDPVGDVAIPSGDRLGHVAGAGPHGE